MKTADLVRMANQIAANCAPYGEAEAHQSIVNHISQFWEPRMRRDLAAAQAVHGRAREGVVVVVPGLAERGQGDGGV